jgi:hypothetical protein
LLLLLLLLLLQYGEAAEHAAFGEEFMKAMSFFTRHSLTGGSTSLKVRHSGCVACRMQCMFGVGSMSS